MQTAKRLTFLKTFPDGWISSSSFRISRVPKSFLSLNLVLAYLKTLSRVSHPGYKTEAKQCRLLTDLYAAPGLLFTGLALTCLAFAIACLDPENMYHGTYVTKEYTKIIKFINCRRTGLMLCFNFILAACEGYKEEFGSMDQLDRDPKRSEKRKEKKRLVVNSIAVGRGIIFKHFITIHIPIGLFMQKLG